MFICLQLSWVDTVWLQCVFAQLTMAVQTLVTFVDAAGPTERAAQQICGRLSRRRVTGGATLIHRGVMGGEWAGRYDGCSAGCRITKIAGAASKDDQANAQSRSCGQRCDQFSLTPQTAHRLARDTLMRAVSRLLRVV